MIQEDVDLLNSCVEWYIQDLSGALSLDSDAQAIKLMREALTRLEEEL